MKKNVFLFFLFLTGCTTSAPKTNLWTHHYNLAVQAMNQQDFQSAIKSYETAITIDSTQADAYEGLAITYLKIGDYDKGIEIYKKAIALNPSKPQSYYNTGGALMNKGKVREALTYFQKGHKLAPDDINILQNMAIAQSRIGDRKGATETAEKSLSVAGDDATTLNIAASIFLQNENYEKSAQILTRVIKKQPKNRDALFNLMIAYRNLGEKQKAIDFFRSYVEKHTEDTEMLYQFLLLLDRVGGHEIEIQKLNEKLKNQDFFNSPRFYKFHKAPLLNPPKPGEADI